MIPTLGRIDHIHVMVADRAAAEAWYARVFGMRRIEELAFWAEGGGPLTLASAEGLIHLALFERPRQPNRATIAIGVTAPQFLAWRKHLQAELGAEPKLEDHALSWSMYFSDPDGNPYEITTYDHAQCKALLA